MTTTPPEPPEYPGTGNEGAPPSYVAPPASPSGAEWGTPPAPAGGYSAPAPSGAYGAPAPAGGYGAPVTYAEWPQRALGALIDFVAPWVVVVIASRISTGLGFLLWLAALGWALYNAYLGGQTGQSYGKKIAGIRLVSETTGQPIGGGMGIARYFVHIVDAIPCYVGFLWPLWDSKKQTFADKLLKTAVIPA